MSATSPAIAQLGKFRSKLEVSDANGIKGAINQLGINMVDLMMWLVIAALLLAAALQGIGYYQQASWNYQAKNDVASVRTFMEAQFTLNNNVYPDTDDLTKALSEGDLKLTGSNIAAITTAAGAQGWSATVQSPDLKEAGKPDLFAFGTVDDTDADNGDQSGNNPKPVHSVTPAP